MELNFSKINGTNNHLDYDVFKHSVISQLESTCKKAEVIILNKFPIVVSAQATIDFVILLNIPKKDKSWYRVELEDDRVNIKNQIIAVSVIDEYKDTSLSIKNGVIEAEGILPSFEEEATKLKWGLTNYLSNHCGLIREYITIHPLIWVRNNSTYGVLENVLVAKNLDYKSVENVIKKNYYFKWQGYKDWYNSNDLFEHQIKKIFDQASKDSEEGYITKKKIDRFQRKLGSKQEEAFDYIGKQLVEVKGKAGTGKTADLLKWMLKGSLDGSKGVFLTYNHLLVYDITSQIQSFINRLPNDTMKASTSTITIHGWFYNIAKKLGVLLLMTEQRINELTTILDNRWVTIEKYFNQERRPGDTSLAWLKMRVQDHWNINEGIKREAILFIQFLDNHLTYLPDQNITSRWFKTFRDEKIEKLANLESSNIFLKDYHKVLERILQAVTNLDEFLDDFNVVDKFDLLSGHMKLSEKLLEIDDPTKMNRDKVLKRYKDSIKMFKWNRVAFVDEAQDCHPLEKDILFNVFNSDSIVIANGDKEQLIRYSQVCNWHVFNGRSVDVHVYKKSQKSYRMKPAVAALANHIANRFDIDLNIEPLDTDDHGQIFISTSNSIEEQSKSIQYLRKIGDRQHCTNYESLILLKPASSSDNDYGEVPIENSIKINEFNNIVKDGADHRSEWSLIQHVQNEISEAYFWNSTGNVDKRKMSVPGALSIRSIYYESCRGIEAWSVMCFGLDTFFESKAKEDEADNYLLGEIIFDDNSPSNKRRQMYAATWVLMAITRSMENCYLQIQNSESTLSKIIMEFAEQNPQYVSGLN